MLPTPENCYQALLSRDPRFDGRLFVGVTSTGIYCRPVCRVRTPRVENCRFFPSAAAAEAAGFRPCLRCRPELAPGRAAVDASARLARAAAGLMEEGSHDGGLAGLAGRLGVSARHLTRVFHGEFGVGPGAYLRSRRLLLAKRLLTETAMPVTEIAYAAGFSSLRTFNAAFRERYGLAPTALRAAGPVLAGETAASFRLAYRPPLDWARLLGFLAKRRILGVEEVDPASGRYRRTVRLAERGGRWGWIEVAAGGGDELRVTMAPELLPVAAMVLARLRRLFDLDCAPDDVLRTLGTLAAARPGLRVPGAFDGFEMAVRAILGQQVSVAAATTLAGRFVAALGEPFPTPWPGLCRVFPTAERVAAADPASIAALGVVGRRAGAIVALARAAADGHVELSPSAAVPDTVRRLTGLPGIGQWTAEYIAMRALAWPDAFPAADLGIRLALGGVSEAEARGRAEAWRPWRAYAVMQLWMGLEEAR